MQPRVPIDVDETSGVWTTDGLPMLYVPRHFFVNNHTAIEAALGREKYAELLYTAGYKSAHYWCAREAQTHGLAGTEVFQHYLTRLSQRGWGRFSFARLDAAAGSADIRLDHSTFVLACPENSGRLCYMFAGWFSGAMDWVRGVGSPDDSSETGEAGPGNDRCVRSTTCRESRCGAEGHSHCLFEVRPRLAMSAEH